MRIVSILAAVLLSASCTINIGSGLNIVMGNGEVAEQTYDLSGFSAIKVAGSMDVFYYQDPNTTSVVLHTDSNLLDCYRIEVDGSTLVISTKEGQNPNPRLKSYVNVTAPAVSSIKLVGSGDCNIPSGVVLDDDFSLAVVGSGDVEASNIECNDFDARVVGSGDIDIYSVKAKGNASFTVSGSGDMEVEFLQAQNASASVSGSGDISLGCNIEGDIDARVSGSGDISLEGNAGNLQKKVSGSGAIHSKGLALRNGARLMK